MNVNTLTIDQVNAELVSRHSRTSGTPEARRQRLQRFLDFEHQKERRDRFVDQMKAEAEAEAELDCYVGCPCNYEEKEEEERVAAALLELRQDAECADYSMKCLKQGFADLDECYTSLVAENMRLNQRINTMETRLAHLENRSPLLSYLQESNPQWELDTAFLS